MFIRARCAARRVDLVSPGVRVHAADRLRALPRSAQAYHAYGTTSVFEEHGVANEVLRAYKDASRDGTLTMRTALVFSPNW